MNTKGSNMKKAVCLLLVLILSLCALASCREKKAEAENTTVSDTAKADEPTVSGYWKGEIEGENVVFDFGKDGKGTMYFTSGGYDFYCELEWSTDNGVFSLTVDGGTQKSSYSLSSDKLDIGGDVFVPATADDVPENALNVVDIINDTEK